MSDRYIKEDDLQYLAKYAYLEALEHCTVRELEEICQSVGICSTSPKQCYLSALQEYRKHELGGKSFNV